MTKKRFLWAFLVALLIGGGFYGYGLYKKDYYSKFVYYVPTEEVATYQAIDEHSVAVLWKEEDQKDNRLIAKGARKKHATFIGKDYFLKEEARLRAVPINLNLFPDSVYMKGLGDVPAMARNQLEKGEYWNFDLYKITDGKVSQTPKKIDILGLIRKENPNFIPKSFGYRELNQQDYIQISGYEKKGATYEESSLYFDINNHAVQALDSTVLDARSKFYVSDLNDYLNSKGIEYRSSKIYLSIEEANSSSEWILAQKYPKVYDILKEGGELIIPQDYDDLDYVASLLQLFTKEGTDFFNGFTIPSNKSIDGQEHRVSSYEEFKQYVKQ